MSVLALARPELRAIKPYRAGAWQPGALRLNANESPYRLASDTTERGLNIYPPPRPEVLRDALAGHYRVAPESLLVTRGSSEAIDILIRGFCAAGADSIVTCPPTFDMYRVYATIQGARIRHAALNRDEDFSLDPEAVVGAVDETTKLVFLCSPNNPTGRALPSAVIERIVESLSRRCAVIVDEAYYEFSSEPNCLPLLEKFDHVIVLRTLSKFVSLAGARCGAVLASPDVIDFLEKILPPYTFPTPSIELVASALDDASMSAANERVTAIRGERERLREALAGMSQVVRVFPSDANFLLVRVRNRARFVGQAADAGILVRAFDTDPVLEDCVRITVGRPDDNDRLLGALDGRS